MKTREEIERWIQGDKEGIGFSMDSNDIRELLKTALAYHEGVGMQMVLKADLTSAQDTIIKLQAIRARFAWNAIMRACSKCGHDEDEDGQCANCIIQEKLKLATDLNIAEERIIVLEAECQHNFDAANNLAKDLVETRDVTLQRLRISLPSSDT